MKRIVGVVPLIDYGKSSYWMLPGYMKGLQEAGAIPIILPLTDDRESLTQLIGGIDALLLTGGLDVSPSRYGEEKLKECGEISPERDNMEYSLLELALEADIPILGICRGIQLLNVYMGGTLYQDLPSQRPSQITHAQKPPYHIPAHSVKLLDSPLKEIIGGDNIEVTSYHHQAIKKLAPGLTVEALSPDGLIESVCIQNARFVHAVQWHPEFTYFCSKPSAKLLKAFVEA